MHSISMENLTFMILYLHIVYTDVQYFDTRYDPVEEDWYFYYILDIIIRRMFLACSSNQIETFC